MSEQPPPFGSPEWAQTMNNAFAQSAMGWAFRRDIERLRAALWQLLAEQLREISAAAALLSSTVDEVLEADAQGSKGRAAA
ncbi:hypothetical protein [Microtetraspora malaysiensis]|uniref:Uncharacterized protein n=1 Tax=Microtetraspora malaysiensis TaxID=161358 RepID=A0ABW6T3B1_9ACTN